MNRYYFTFGSSESMPFQGGWVIVTADTEREAVNKFNVAYGLSEDGFVNCCSWYTEKEFERTSMGKNDSNLGKSLQAVIF